MKEILLVTTIYLVVFAAVIAFKLYERREERRLACLFVRHRHPSTAAYTTDEAMWEAELNQPPTKETNRP